MGVIVEDSSGLFCASVRQAFFCQDESFSELERSLPTVYVYDKPKGYEFVDTSGETHQGLTSGQVIYLLKEALAQAIYDSASFLKGYSLVHASAVLIHGEAVVFVGSSHSGKTSLSLALKNFGIPYSDEFVWLNCANAIVLRESCPFCLRSSSLDLLDEELREQLVPCETLDDFRSFLLPLKAFNKVPAATPLGLVVFLDFLPGSVTKIDRLHSSELPRLLKDSFMGKAKRGDCIKDFLKMLKVKEIKIEKLSFSDVEDAARLLSAEINP